MNDGLNAQRELVLIDQIYGDNDELKTNTMEKTRSRFHDLLKMLRLLILLNDHNKLVLFDFSTNLIIVGGDILRKRLQFFAIVHVFYVFIMQNVDIFLYLGEILHCRWEIILQIVKLPVFVRFADLHPIFVKYDL